MIAAALAVIAYFTLRPTAGPTSWVEADCCLTADFVANVVLFLPLGIGLALAGLSPRKAMIAGTIASVAIEIIQRWIPGRGPAVHDVVTNAIGTLAGAILVVTWSRRTRWWKVVGPILALAVVAGSIGGSFLVHPAVPTPSTWYGWAGTQRSPGVFYGRVVRFTLQGVPIADGPVPAADQLGRQIERDSVQFEVTLISGPPTRGLVDLVGVAAGAVGGDYLWLSQRGRDLDLYLLLRTRQLGLPSPWLRIKNALPDIAGDTVRITGAIVGSGATVRAVGGRTSIDATFARTPALFWAGFLPFDLPVESTGSLWLLAPILLPFVGLGMAIGNRAGAAGAVALALWAGPLAAGIAAPSVWTAAGALAAAGGGRLLAQRVGLLVRR